MTCCSSFLGCLSQLLVSLAVAYGIAIAAEPILRTRGGWARVAGLGAAAAVLFCPLWIAPEKVGFRAIAAFCCIELMFKMIDYARQQRRTDAGGTIAADWMRYLRFLFPFPVLLVVFGQRENRLSAPVSWRRELSRVILGAAVVGTGFLLLHLVLDLDPLRSCFALDHAAKLGMFVVTIEALSQMLYGLERLAGFDTRPVIRSIFVSRTVGEFWCRYNGRVHAWMESNVFRPSGGRRAPVRGVILTFLVSAILHELMFGIATSRFDGYQFTFFMLQVPAVLASPGLERLARRGIAGKALAHGFTVLWLSVTSVFFFHGVNRVFPFVYASRPWLP